MDYDHLFKLLLVGDSAVGKTSLLLNFTGGAFEEHQKNTVGVDLKVKMMRLREQLLKLTIWDTAGQERFRTLTSAYYRGAHGIILVYDITDRDSFANIKRWLEEVKIYSTNVDAVMMLVGNKTDRASERTVTTDEASDFARTHNMLYMEASAQSGECVQQAFEELIHKILDVPTLLDGPVGGGGVGAGSGGSSSSSSSVRLDNRNEYHEDDSGGGACC